MERGVLEPMVGIRRVVWPALVILAFLVGWFARPLGECALRKASDGMIETTRDGRVRDQVHGSEPLYYVLDAILYGDIDAARNGTSRRELIYRFPANGLGLP